MCGSLAPARGVGRATVAGPRCVSDARVLGCSLAQRPRPPPHPDTPRVRRSGRHETRAAVCRDGLRTHAVHARSCRSRDGTSAGRASAKSDRLPESPRPQPRTQPWATAIAETAWATASATPGSNAPGTTRSAVGFGTNAASAAAAASFIESLHVVARTSSSPRNTPGNASTLLIWFA